MSPSRLFYSRPVRDPDLPALDDGRDKSGAGASMLAEKRRRKEKQNMDTSRLDHNPTPLRIGLQVLWQDSKTKNGTFPGKLRL